MFSNGISQHGLTSPKLCNVHTNDVNCLFAQSKVGFHISGKRVDHVSYTDDLVLLVPCSEALQWFVNSCSTYAIEHGIIFNTLKKVCMVFCLRGQRDFNVRKFKLDGVEF